MKLSYFLRKNCFFNKHAFRSWHLFLFRIWCQDASILGFQIWKIKKNVDLKRYQKHDRFLNGFGSVSEPNLELFWLGFSAKDGPRGLQDAPGCRTGALFWPRRPPNISGSAKKILWLKVRRTELKNVRLCCHVLLKMWRVPQKHAAVAASKHLAFTRVRSVLCPLFVLLVYLILCQKPVDLQQHVAHYQTKLWYRFRAL